MWFLMFFLGVLVGHYVLRDIKTFVKSRKDEA